ncbi:MAG: HAMP domain-containing sensor histidine kinase [Bacteroidota bacterium]
MLKIKSKSLLFLYLIFFYVVAFSMWWAYLLYSKNELSFKEMVDLKTINYAKEHVVNTVKYTDTAEYKNISDKYNRQKKMILSEGSFFMIILFFGFLFVRRSLVKELTLSNRQKNFLLSITHELKSPLASIKLVIQTIMKRDLNEEAKKKFLHNSLYDVERLESLVENILIATKFENDTYGFVKEEIDLSYILQMVQLKFEAYNKKDIKIEFDIAPQINMMGDKIGIMSVFVNLIENALKYSPEQTTIKVSLVTQESMCVFTVADEGVGISNEEKNKIFDKFYRVGNEETRNTKGTGLGLYIVNNIVKYHGGTIKIKDNIPQGTIFIISFNLLN